MKEFEDVYAKNAGGYEVAKDDSLQKLKNFLDLYVNFKMKLRDAQVRGYDTDPELQNELEEYKQKVGETYLIEKEIIDPGIKQLYDRRKEELRVSHIMFRYTPENEDSIKNFVNSIIDSLNNGADFNSMVQKYTVDNFSKPSGGDIYYITSGMLPVEFEDAAYQTKVGEIYPKPVKTKFGYHIIKVTDKRDRIPQIHASHILIAIPAEGGGVDTAASKARIDSILAQLKNGADFAELAKKYSDDTGTKNNGGDLGFFERRMMVKEFDEAAFNLGINEISEPIKTQFGYHIIKLLEKKSYPDFASEKENLKQIFKQTRYQAEYDKLVDSLRQKYNYKLNDETFNTVISLSDSVKVGGEHPKMDEMGTKTLFTYNNKSVDVKTFYDKMTAENEYLNKLINEDLLKRAVDKISADYLIEAETMNLEKTNKEFAALMDDYKNGIYIFKLQEDEVWNKVAIDSVKLLKLLRKDKRKLCMA